MDVTLAGVQMRGAQVILTYNRKIDRHIGQYTDGDNLEDLGRHSKEFAITSSLPLAEFLAFEKSLEKGQPTFTSPFGTYKVVVKRIEYSDQGSLQLLLVEDIQ